MQRESRSPRQFFAHDVTDLFDGMLSFRYGQEHLVVNVRSDVKSSSIELEHDIAETVTRCCLYAVVYDQRAPIAGDDEAVPRPAVEQVINRFVTSGVVNSESPVTPWSIL